MYKFISYNGLSVVMLFILIGALILLLTLFSSAEGGILPLSSPVVFYYSGN
jgi:hypothetical protein